jgi:2-keto-4-pentenoate hydratase/2-oxohepta-3-ene-1,7-dioic acid hydratase in catechol pathway
MKLLRYGPKGAEKPGLLDAEGEVRDLSGVVDDITPELLSPAGLARLSTIDPRGLPRVDRNARFGVPLTGVGQYVAVGLNYADHAAETGRPAPPEPILFCKAITCLNGPNDPVMLPRGSVKTDWEVELGVVIGQVARYVNEAEALDHVAGYVLVNDFSERAYQNERGGTWFKGKGCDTFGPVGPWITTADEIGDPQDLALWLEVNGRRMQDGSSRNMIFSVRKLIAYISHFVTLMPGDLIATGTPAGVGTARRPEPIYLKAGDEVRLGGEGLGEQRQEIVAYQKG